MGRRPRPALGVRRAGRAERHHPGAALSPDADAGLEMYLAGPVCHELRRAFETRLPDTTFVFGHTHKPFVGTRGVAGYARPIAVVNTGGWVVDHPEAEPLKGASVVLVDDEANVVSLQLYRQRSDGAADPPAVVPADARSIAFAEQVRSGVDATRDPWAPVHRRRGGDPRRSSPRAAAARGRRPPTAPSRRDEAGLMPSR